MKVRRILVLVAAAAFAQMSYAAKAVGEHEAPRPRTLPPVRVQGPDYAQLGAEQAVLDFCSRIDSTDLTAYEAQAKIVFAGIREDGLEKARASSQYQSAYATLASVLGEIPLPEAVQGCKGLLPAGAPAKASGKPPVSTPVSNNTGNSSGHPVGKSTSQKPRTSHER